MILPDQLQAAIILLQEQLQVDEELTLTAVTCILDGDRCHWVDEKDTIKHMANRLVPFAVGELFGPCRCAHEGCNNEAWIIWMTAEEKNQARQRNHPVNYVFEEGIGKPLCENHDPVEEKA